MRALAACLSAMLLLSGCGGGGSDPPSADTGATPIASPTVSPSPSPSPSPTPSPTPTPPPPPPAGTGDVIWGAAGHPTIAYGAVTLEEQMASLRRLGLTHYRVGGENPDLLDRMLTVAEQYGVTLLPVLVPDTNFDGHSASEIYANSYASANRMAARFRGRVKTWELGNELEGYAILMPCEMRDDGWQYPCTWGPAGGVTALEYYGPRWQKVSAALKGMSDGVRAADPSARRAAGAAGWGHTGMFDRMKADGIGWEISVWHVYRIAEDEWAYKLLQAHGKPIWLTEFNHPYGSHRDGEQAQANGLRQMMADFRAMRKYGVEAAFVYELLDEPYWTDFQGKMGLIRMVQDSGGRWVLGADKPSAEAVRSTIAAGG